ncbi:CHASE domain-containing protein [Massilia oculi]|uniref:histidine kinase n=1 Tax=Massilia hydrophila TaxID=3044279 RepID=A0ABS7YAL7_9BURK|nr:CHASE domain-containing protein [Massilia oculi]MCA1855339.1 CHASE domain-containing protein [Massilia oculi]
MDSSTIARPSRDAAASRQQGGAAPWVAGIALALAVGGLCHRVATGLVEEDARRRFETVARLAQERVSNAIVSYTRVVRGMVALHVAGEGPLTRLRLHRYVQALDLPAQFPAIEAVSYIAYVPDAERDAFIASVRQDRSVDPAGYPQFDIRPAGRRPWYAVITWVEPGQQPNDRVGFDIAAQPQIAAVLERARDEASLGASGNPVRLAHPTPHTALGMREPLYRGGAAPATLEERRARYMGSIGIAFSVDALVRQALGPQERQPVALSLYSETAPGRPGAQEPLQLDARDRLLVGPDVRGQSSPGGRFSTLLPIDYAGTRWKAHFSAERAAMAVGADRYLPLLAFGSGFGVSLLGFALFFNLVRSRRMALDQRMLLVTVLDNLDAHVYLKDSTRRFRYLNAKSAAMIGLPAAQIVGRRDIDVSPDMAEATWARDSAALESRERHVCQVELPLPDGSVRQMWSVRVPLFPEGELPAVLCISTDVTALHELRARADAASQAKSGFLSNMSHEIRTPMNSIIGMTHLALQAGPEPRLRAYLEKIYHSGQHLLGIINDILDFSKIEAGKLELATRVFLLEAVMRNVELQLGQAAAAKGLGFDIDIAPALARPLRGDPLRLEQVLLNFAGNAVKFSEQGRICLRARLEHAFGPELLVRFEVQDHGIGIAPGQLAGLFTPFHQADPSATRRHGGTGLGLVISKQLAELMHGEVGVDSIPGQGSTFWFTARLALEDGVGAGLGAAPAPSGQPARLDGCSILLAEDNPFNQQVARELLAQAGATVEVAGNGAEALALLDAMVRRPDCVLMDVQMPVMDGLEATRRIRQDPRLRGLLVIAMTANAGLEDRARCLEAGMDEFLTKPVVPELLAATIARCLGRSEAPAPDLASCAQHPGAGGAAAVDLAALAASFGGDRARMRKYAFLFVASARAALDEIDTALAAGELDAAGAVAHRVRSAARTVGAAGFADLCGELEAQAGAGRAAQARALGARLRAQLARVERAFSGEFGMRAHDRQLESRPS